MKNYKGKSTITLDPELKKAIMDAKDEAALDKARERAIAHLAAQMPRSFFEQLNSWRYLCMLGNLRTHIRNITGNISMFCMVMKKNFLAGAISDVFLRGSVNHISEYMTLIDAKNGQLSNVLTADDAENIKSIPRKSVSSFSEAEFKKTKGLAQKYFSEMGEKSPLFRAWLGDWREYDCSEVTPIKKKGELRSTSERNKDTGWDIIISRHISKETLHHSSSAQNALKYMPYIKDITQNAVLLNSEPSDKENPLSVMFHTLYAYTEAEGYPALLKLVVEELREEK